MLCIAERREFVAEARLPALATVPCQFCPDSYLNESITITNLNKPKPQYRPAFADQISIELNTYRWSSSLFGNTVSIYLSYFPYLFGSWWMFLSSLFPLLPSLAKCNYEIKSTNVPVGECCGAAVAKPFTSIADSLKRFSSSASERNYANIGYWANSSAATEHNTARFPSMKFNLLSHFIKEKYRVLTASMYVLAWRAQLSTVASMLPQFAIEMNREERWRKKTTQWAPLMGMYMKDNWMVIAIRIPLKLCQS